MRNECISIVGTQDYYYRRRDINSEWDKVRKNLVGVHWNQRYWCGLVCVCTRTQMCTEDGMTPWNNEHGQCAAGISPH